jgi:hypothetical protein
MIILKGKEKSNIMTCDEESCQDENTQIWASSESRIVDLCDLHYNQVKNIL